jgi:hypothetical protein
MVRRGPRLNDRLRRFLRYRTGQHSLAARRAFLSRSQRDRILSLYHNKLGRKPPHRSDIPLAHGSHHTSWSVRVLCWLCLLGWIFCLFCFPETAGLTLEEVQLVFEQGFGFAEMRATQKRREHQLDVANV